MISRRLLAVPFLLSAGCGERREAASPAAAEQAALSGSSGKRPGGDEAEADPRIALKASLDQASREQDTAAREKILESVAWDAIDVDPAISREAFAAMTPGSASSRRLVGHFAMRLADDSPDKAIAWAGDLEQAEERSEAFGRIAVVLSASDPAAAAALVAEEMTAGPPRDRAVVQVLQRWSQSAPADAAGWIAAFPPGTARSSGLKVVAAAWIESDPAALAAWVEARERGQVRLEAILAVVQALRPAPETRASRLAHFRDPAIQKQIENILSQSPP